MVKDTFTAKEIKELGGFESWHKFESSRATKSGYSKKEQDQTVGLKVVQKKVSESKKTSEHEEQKRLLEVCKLHEKKYPGLDLIFSIPNGQIRHPAVAARLKEEGVKAGVPDLFIPVPRGNAHGLFIEMKARKGRLSPPQCEMLEALARQGYACIIAYGWENAWCEIEAYFNSNDLELSKVNFK